MIRTILIIGANSDIAYEFMLQAAKHFKPNLFLLASKNIDHLNQIAADIRIRSNIVTQTFELDVSDTNACGTFYAGLPASPDLVVYAAGYLGDQKEAEQNAAEAEKILAINYQGAMILLNDAALAMAEKKQGTILALSSVAGLRGRKKNYLYGAAKAALTTYLSGLRNRLAPDHVQVITVLPGFVDTKMVRHLNLPKKLTATPKQVADCMIHAIEHHKEIVYVKKIWWWVMTIITLIPEKMFKRMDI